MNIAIFIHQPVCSVDSANGVLKALSKGNTFKLFSRDLVEPTFFDDVDLVCVPGGIGDSNRFDNLMIYNHDYIKDYVSNGGKYLGICMGAYWAGKHYFNFIDEIDCVQYIKRPNTDTRRPHAKAMPINWQGQDCKMFFYDGCAIVGNLRNTDILATYTNGDAMAVIQNNIGLIGCHPESDRHWYDHYSWLKKETTFNHGNLLKSFVDLML